MTIKKIMRWKIVTGTTIVILFIVSSVVFLLRDVETRYRVLQHPFIAHYVHVYHSFRKLPDIFFLTYLFVRSDIPTYEISISLNNVARLNAALPNEPISGRLEEENKLYVAATFSDSQSGYSDRVKVRYRGLNANHWNSLKKSIRVQFPDTNFFEGKRLINFVVPYDRRYLIGLLNMKRAKDVGLIDTDISFVRLKINGRDAGVYIKFEQWGTEWLAKKSLPETRIYRVADGLDGTHVRKEDYEDITDNENERNEEIAALIELIYRADNEQFKALVPHIVDLNKLYAWNILNILAGSNHQDEIGNTILYFNTSSGLFEFIPWDININDQSKRSYNDADSILMRRVLSFPEFKLERDLRLKTWISDEARLEDDLKFYDELSKKMRKEFLSDNTKLYNNFQYLSEIKRVRSLIVDNWNRALNILDDPPEYTFEAEPSTPNFQGSFANLGLVNDSLNTFLSRNPQFFVRGRTIFLSGTNVFNNDVLIPSGYRLEILQGARLLLGSDVSVISYSPIFIGGTNFNPIKISRLNSSKKWGSFAVINASTESVVEYLVASGGSGILVNGVSVTGMVSFHNSDVDISNSVFREAGDDDAINVKGAKGSITDSLFENNVSDALDIDFSKEDFSIIGNVFLNNQGDAIDLSYSKVVIDSNLITGCADKGISVGERSRPNIVDNSISDCDIGIAVKDQSEATIERNVIKNNRVGISLFIKKQEFGGAHAVLIENVLENNIVNIESDIFSSYE